jgi:hypothetical protein
MKMLKPRPQRPAPLTGATAANLAVHTLPAAPAALQQASNFNTLLGEAVARSAGNSAATAAMLPLMLRPDTGAELMELQFAVAERMQQLQQDWWQSWNDWLAEFGRLGRSSTMSEQLEQQYNITEQFTALLKSQAGDLMDLQENWQVDYGYWVAQKLDEAGVVSLPVSASDSAASPPRLPASS